MQSFINVSTFFTVQSSGNTTPPLSSYEFLLLFYSALNGFSLFSLSLLFFDNVSFMASLFLCTFHTRLFKFLFYYFFENEQTLVLSRKKNANIKKRSFLNSLVAPVHLSPVCAQGSVLLPETASLIDGLPAPLRNKVCGSTLFFLSFSLFFFFCFCSGPVSLSRQQGLAARLRVSTKKRGKKKGAERTCAPHPPCEALARKRHAQPSHATPDQKGFP